MSVRSGGGRQFSFELLAGDSSGDERSLSLLQIPGAIYENGGRDGHTTRRKRKSKAAKKKKSRAAGVPAEEPSLLPESDAAKATWAGNGTEIDVSECRSVVESVAPELERIWELNGSELASKEPRIALDSDARNPSFVENGSYRIGTGFVTSDNRSVTESVCENMVVMPEFDSLEVSCISHVELRQRNANGDIPDKPTEEGSSTRESSTGQWIAESNGHLAKLETVESVDWNRVLAEDPNLLGEVSSLESSPFKYFMGEIYGGSSLRSTISVGNDKKRQRVYNTMFHVPLRCERLILAGFFVCLDSFLSLLTIMPARILMAIWRVLNTRQFQRPNAAELSDFGCFVVLAFGVASLQSADISLIYHIIRGQGILKLYVLYNVLEIFDKLCQSFGEDVLQVLFNSAEGLANCSADNVAFELIRFIFDQIIAVVAFIVHSFILLAQAVTLSTCIIAHNNALLALLVSNNFSEIKSNVFKRVSKENLHNLVYYDIVERFHITAFVLFVLAQNILEAEGPWFESFLTNALLVYMCEVFIDMIKHSFLAKFNEIKPVAYSDFLEDLCKQTLNDKSEERRQDLTFIPLAPACVVIRVLTPIYGTLLPYGPLPWRLFWIVLWSTLTYFMLAICKIMVGLSLRRLASWYVNQRLRRKQHMD